MVMASSSLAAEWVTHKVKRGESLMQLARRYDTTVNNLKQWNGLTGDRIMIDQVLKVGRKSSPDKVHVVVRGDNLTKIAQQHDTTVEAIKRINDLSSDRIYIGQKLRLIDADLTVHIVERGDALWEIARAYGMTVGDLKRLNNLDGDRIYIGQELKLNGTAARTTITYTIKRGDNLTEIARLHQMSLSELRRLNNLRGSVIHPGQELRVRPIPGATAPAPETPESNGVLDWAELNIPVAGVRRFNPGNGPYYYEKPTAARQKSKNYREESSINPKMCYQHATKLLAAFDRKLGQLPRLSRHFEGWHFVLDPGHGGIDPGAIVRSTDAAGKATYIVEDEYAYDLTLRVYALLKLHGAKVTLTVISPNHLLRGNTPVSDTFVHDRNEVFNDRDWNRRDRPQTWVKGGQVYLNQRVKIARRALKNAPKDKQVFLSFHADNDPPSGEVVTLLYYQNGRTVDSKSRDLAKRLLPDMGAGAKARGKNLGVLRSNPTTYKLLVEMRNLAYDDHVWAVRYEELRRRDAEKVVQALLGGLAPR